MYKYNPCAPGISNNTRSVPLCPPIVGQGAAIPESARMASVGCISSYVLGTVVATTLSPIVNVGTVPASVTTAARSQSTMTVNTYDPATRFSQYFPPAPLPYIPPSMNRVPNNDPKPSVEPCVPAQRYESTAETLARKNMLPK